MTAQQRELLKQVWQLEESQPRVRQPVDMLPMLQKWVGRSQEHFLCLNLNGAHELLGVKEITKGLVNRTLVHPREVFRQAIKANAVAVILAHNHPSGVCEPSREDREVTRRMAESGHILGIAVLDHLIVGRRGYYSFLEHGEM